MDSTSFLTVGLSNIQFRLALDDAPLGNLLADRYGSFCGPMVDDPACDSTFEFDCRGTPLDMRHNPTGAVVSAGTRWVAEGGEQWGWLDLESRSGRVVPHPSMTVVDMFMRATLTQAALQKGGLVVHASAVELPSGVHVFLGRSGSGKSTVAQKLSEEGGRVLSDEVVALLPDATAPLGFSVYGTPFWVGSPKPAPIRAIWALKFGQAGWRRLGWVDGLRLLDTNLSLIVQNDWIVRKALDSATRIAGAVQAFEMTFRLTDQLVPLLEAIL